MKVVVLKHLQNIGQLIQYFTLDLVISQVSTFAVIPCKDLSPSPSILQTSLLERKVSPSNVGFRSLL
jgi:hypothetical protein